MAAMSSEGDGVIYAIAEVGSCTGEAKMSVILNVLFFLWPPRKKKSPPEDGTPVCTPHIFAILVLR